MNNERVLTMQPTEQGVVLPSHMEWLIGSSTHEKSDPEVTSKPMDLQIREDLKGGSSISQIMEDIAVGKYLNSSKEVHTL